MNEASLAQQGVWFTEQAGIAGTAYHMAISFRFSGDVDEAALEAACGETVCRHPILSSAVVVKDGSPRLVPAAVPAPIIHRPLHGTCLPEQVRRPFDLATGPLARFVLDASGPQVALLFVAHHMVFDGMSKDILVRDLAVAYRAHRRGQPSPGAAPTGTAPRGAAAPEYSSDESRREACRVTELLPAAREYWQSRWREADGVVLPGLARTPSTAEPGHALDIALGDEIGSALDAAVRQLDATRFEVLLAALHAVLFRYGNTTPMVAIDLSTRTEAVADHIGLFVNELPVVLTDPTAYQSTFAELVRGVRAELRELYRFRSVPLGRAVSGLRPRTALAPVSMSYRRRGTAPEFDGVGTVIDWMVFPGAVRNALHLQIVDDGLDLAMSLGYSPAALEPEAATRIALHLRTLLRAALADPDRAVSDLPLLPPDELDQVLRKWNATGRAYPPAATVLSLFDERVSRDPDAIAVVGPTLGMATGTVTGAAPGTGQPRTLTYRELADAVHRLAATLRERGARHGALVGVCLPRTVEMLVTLLAVGAAGAAWVPMDPSHPARRRALIIDEAEPALIVTTRGLADASADGHADASTSRPAVLLLDGPDGTTDALGTGLADAGSTPPPAVTVTPDDAAYVMFTSGSTGRPKGVVVGHRALANLLQGMRDALPAGPRDIWLGLTSVAFDISMLELFLPLTTGGRVVIVPDGVGADGQAVIKVIRDHRVSHVQATPSGWSVLLAAGLGERTPTGSEPVVALAGGEALPLPLARELRPRVERLINVYGPTETTIWSTMAELPADPDAVTIGTPIANTRAYLLDATRRPVPIGVAGELYLGGTGVADGYLHRPDLTAARFLADPFAMGARMYRTGDRAYQRPDGNLVFLGRLDNQVKIRGHRVELGEIESRLLEHPAVAQVAVVLRTDDEEGGHGEPRLIAYLVSRHGHGPEPTPTQLRDHLARWLPTAALPEAWVSVEHLPLTPNGKLDRAALPTPPRERPPAAAPGTGDPGDDKLAEQVREIWRDVLRMDDIGLDEDLFDLGGHSLTITRIIGRIERQLGVSVPFDSFFDEPTCRGVAAEIRRLRRRAGDGPADDGEDWA